MNKYAEIKLDPYGVVVDTNPHDVESEWTAVNNMRFNDTAAEKIGGEVYASTLLQTAYHLQFNGNHASPEWYYMGDSYIARTNFDTEVDLSSGVTIGSGTDWDSHLFNFYPIFNNTVDAPWYWDLTSADVARLPAFPADTTCEAIRPYRSFMIALNITDSAVIQPNRLIWSDSSDAGAVPASWDIADPTTLAGDAWLTDEKGEIIDGAQLRDLFVIYKTHSMYLLRLTNLQSVMKVEKVQINSGLLAKNCITEYEGKHFVVADGDIVLFDGQSIQSIADKRVRSEIFDNIDSQYFYNSYVVRYDRQDEIWFCYPTTGQEWATKTAIWNYKDNTWTFRELKQSRHIASGLANFAVGTTYAAADFTYNSESANRPYNIAANNPTSDTLVGTSLNGGEEENPDVGFDNEPAWALVNCTISGGKLNLGSTSIAGITSNNALVDSTRYKIILDVDSVNLGLIEVELGTNNTVINTSATGVNTFIVDSGTPPDDLIQIKKAVGTAVINSISIRRESSILGIFDEGFNLYDIPMQSSLEKHSMDLGNEDRVKIINSVTPRITADNGTKVYISVGIQMNPDDAITWTTEQLYTVGTDRESYFTVKGRYISIKFRTQDLGTSWKLHGFFFKAAEAGRH